jgi:Ca-activated chloride channel family protein
MTRAACALLAVLASAAVAGQPAFRSSVQTVAIHATVRDASGKLVTNLTKDQFAVYDDGKPIEITTFSNDIQPLTVALLLDMSGSMIPRVVFVRDATLKFINVLLPEDRVRIGTFGDEIAISPILTADKAILTRIAREELWPGGKTPLWNAMYAGMESLASETGRRVILVLTDGVNDGSLPGWNNGFDDVRDRAIKDGFMLYAVDIEGSQQNEDAKRKFVALIDDTGGGRFEVGPKDDLDSAFVRIADELRRQYLIGFTPAARDGRVHKLEVKVTDAGLRVRARTSYVAERR